MVLDLSGRNIYQLPVSFLKCQGWLNPFNTLTRLAIIHHVHAPTYEPSVMVDGGSWRHGLFSPKQPLKISNFSCWWVASLVELHHGGAGKWGYYWDLTLMLDSFSLWIKKLDWRIWCRTLHQGMRIMFPFGLACLLSKTHIHVLVL